jgi:23S rRNA (cytidine2498-2'-O)-methyltransferase
MIAVAARDVERPLLEELGETLIAKHGRLFEFDGERLPHWTRNVWLEPMRVQFQSIGEAAKVLRAIQRNWAHHPNSNIRRGELIQAQLPKLQNKPKTFPFALPTQPLGSWTLLDEHTLLYSARCTSLFPDGEIEFVENKTEPPSRAYLKLWEAFTLEQILPSAGSRVLDLGSSPGGWTWVLDQLGCNVVSVDKAELSATTKFSSRVEYRCESAFALEPKSVGEIDWLFSDVICYPDRLLKLVQRWLAEGRVRNFLCTLKFQGPTDHTVIEEFLRIPGGRVRYLSANKHELTWILRR